MSAAMEEEAIIIREVYHWNFKEEERRLLSALSSDFYAIAFDTEYPGTIINTPQFAGEEERYRDMKCNVERTKLIQVGFTVFNPVTAKFAGVWQFNLSGFDPEHHVHSAKSVELLRRSGIDFSENKAKGVKMWQLANLLKRIPKRVEWITFHGLYDVAYLLAAVEGHWKLPEDIDGFRMCAGRLFSGGIFDLKCMAGQYNMSWMGLEKLAAALGTAREQGWAHQAGSDSLLTAKAFIRALQCSRGYNVEQYRRRLFGISHPISSPPHPHPTLLIPLHLYNFGLHQRTAGVFLTNSVRFGHHGHSLCYAL